MKAFLLYFFSTKLWAFCSIFWNFFYIFHFSKSVSSVKNAPLKKFWWHRLEKLFLKAFFIYKKILSQSENKRITCWLFLSFLNKLMAQGLFHPRFTNTPLPTTPCTHLPFIPGYRMPPRRAPCFLIMQILKLGEGEKPCTLSFLSWFARWRAEGLFHSHLQQVPGHRREAGHERRPVGPKHGSCRWSRWRQAAPLPPPKSRSALALPKNALLDCQVDDQSQERVSCLQRAWKLEKASAAQNKR